MVEAFDEFELDEEGVGFGAMVCDMSTFRSIYRHHVRSLDRRSEDAVLIMIRARQTKQNGIDEEQMGTVINRIGAALASRLRRHDVLTGFDTSFFLILLFNTSLEGAETVIKRLVEKINEEVGEDADIETKIQALATITGEKLVKV